jgi:hypothetical protein
MTGFTSVQPDEAEMVHRHIDQHLEVAIIHSRACVSPLNNSAVDLSGSRPEKNL